MRVIEPKTFKKQKTNSNRKKINRHFTAGFITLGGLLLLVFFFNSKLNAPPKNDITSNVPSATNQNDKREKLKTFTTDEFRDLYNNFAYPNTEQINERTPITGSTKADDRIRKLAEARGYRLRSAPVSSAFVKVSESHSLQRRAANDWQKLFLDAKQSKIDLSIAEALRSAEDQKKIFLSRLGSISEDSIADGFADAQVNKVLEKAAPPGYSRHHSGYTVDLICGSQPNSRFEDSICYDWLKKDNYLNVKRHGWIPSYPEGAEMQGPEPEAWEYVWVGINALSE